MNDELEPNLRSAQTSDGLTDSAIISSRHNATAILTLRAERITRASVKQFLHHLHLLSADEEVRVIVVTGPSDGIFCLGADLDEVAGAKPQELTGYIEEFCQLVDLLDASPKPVIAAISGKAAGGGCEIALSCHLRLASTEACFVASEVPLGLAPIFGFSRRMPRLAGKARALEFALTGSTLSAADAHHLCLVNHIVASASLLDETLALAGRIGSSAPLAVRRALEAMAEGQRVAPAAAFANERRLFAECFGTEDMREGVRAFLEKRAPQFKGR